MGMAKAKTLITTPYPTAEQIGKVFGMSKTEIRRSVAEMHLIMDENDKRAARKAARKKAARNAARREQRARLKASGPSR
jgi:hypothetical protein